MRTSGLLFTCILVAVTLSAIHSVKAQSIDYGALEGLFKEPITTAATGNPQRASEVATNMTIITSDEIRQSGSRSIPEILSRVPGLDILQEGINNWDVGVRGYQQPYQPRLLVLIDGRQVFNEDYSRMAWDNLPVNIDDIRQIEVVKGASSALFGSNATGGVINIITYSPIYDKSDVASISVGSQNELTGDATATVPLGGMGGLKVSAGGLSLDEFDTARTAGESSNEVRHPYHRYAAQNSIVQIDKDFSINTEANFSEKNGDEADFLNVLVPSKATIYSTGAGFNWQTPYGLIKSTNYFNHYYAEVLAAGRVGTSNDLVVSQLEDQFKIGADHTFRAMVEYDYKNFKATTSPTAQPEDPDLNENSYAASGTWLWNLTDKVSMTNAVRFDQNTMYMNGLNEANPFWPRSAYNQAYNTISVNSGLVYEATEQDTLRATYGRGVQKPSEIQSGFNNNIMVASGTELDAVGNPNLKPTIVDNYELGYDHKLPEMRSVAKLSAYYEFNHDLIANMPSGWLGSDANGVISESINVGNSKGWGGEFELKGSDPSGFRWDGSYSYQTIRDAALVATTLGYSNSAPEHHLRLLLGYTLDKWEIDGSSQYVTSTNMLRTMVTGNNPTNVSAPDYLSFSGRLGYQVTEGATLSASAFNINHGYLQASAYPQIERQFLLTLTDRF